MHSLQTDLNICKEEALRAKKGYSYLKENGFNKRKKAKKQTYYRNNNEFLKYITQLMQNLEEKLSNLEARTLYQSELIH